MSFIVSLRKRPILCPAECLAGWPAALFWFVNRYVVACVIFLGCFEAQFSGLIPTCEHLLISPSTLPYALREVRTTSREVRVVSFTITTTSRCHVILL